MRARPGNISPQRMVRQHQPSIFAGSQTTKWVSEVLLQDGASSPKEGLEFAENTAAVCKTGIKSLAQGSLEEVQCHKFGNQWLSVSGP